MIKIPEDMITGTKYVTEKYGELEIVEYESHASVRVRFTATGYMCSARTQHIREGRVKDVLYPRVYGVGFVGIGPYNGDNSHRAYGTWNSMLSRCYDKKTHLKRPTYIGCSVAPEWHNFQTFAAWHEDNYPKDGGKYDLDKDIKVVGNRIYSSETCLFVTPAENKAAAQAKTYILLTPKNKRRVLVHNLSEFCRKVGLSQGNIANVVIGKRKRHKGWSSAIHAKDL